MVLTHWVVPASVGPADPVIGAKAGARSLECAFVSCFKVFLLFAGVDFKMKTVDIDGIKVRVQIW